MTRQIAVLEEQKNEDLEKDDDDDEEEAKPSDSSPGGPELNSQSNGLNEKPDINDVPMEEPQVKIIAGLDHLLLAHFFTFQNLLLKRVIFLFIVLTWITFSWKTLKTNFDSGKHFLFLKNEIKLCITAGVMETRFRFSLHLN